MSAADQPAQPGTVHLVGAGPGDPGLVTRRALALVRTADVIYLDRLVTPQLVAEARADAEVIDVGKVAGNHAMPQDEINARLVADARAGRRVVRLKGGDPYLFGRGGEEAICCHEAGVPFEVVPAVTSAFAASADAGIPVTHRDLSRHVTVVTASAGRDGQGDPDYAWLAQSDGTIVLLMGLRRTLHVAEQLVSHGMGPDTPVAIVARGTTDEQHTVVGTLATIADLVERTRPPSPAIIVVGQVVELRDQLSWFERRPLFGTTVGVTRARAQASELVSQLRGLGARVVEAPAIRIEALPPAELDALLDELDGLRTLVFTSTNSVEPFFARLAERGLDARALAGVQVAAVGAATEEACLARGVRADIVPPRGARTSMGLLEALGTDGAVFGTAVGVVRAEQADERFIAGLEGLGASVRLARVYRTVTETSDPALVEALLGCDVLTFTSESTVRNVRELLPADAVVPPAVTIGPTTTSAAAWAGIQVLEEAATPSIESLVESVLARAAANRTRVAWDVAAER